MSSSVPVDILYLGILAKMEQGGENPISIESKSVNDNSVSATSLRPTLKASDLRSTMASLNSNDTPLTQTGIPQAGVYVYIS